MHGYFLQALIGYFPPLCLQLHVITGGGADCTCLTQRNPLGTFSARSHKTIFRPRNEPLGLYTCTHHAAAVVDYIDIGSSSTAAKYAVVPWCVAPEAIILSMVALYMYAHAIQLCIIGSAAELPGKMLVGVHVLRTCTLIVIIAFYGHGS